MTSRDFCYWLQGYLELRNGKDSGMSTEQAKCIANHLNLVFAHEIDPSMGDKVEQIKLDAIHKPVPVKYDFKDVIVRC